MKELLDLLGGPGALPLKKADGTPAVVGIKVNLVSPMAPEKAGTTHPSLLRALCGILTEQGCDVIIGDSPGGIYTEGYLGMVYHSCGLEELEKMGDPDRGIGSVRLNRNFNVSKAAFPEAVSLKNFEYTSWLDDCDVLINFAKLKTHAMLTMTCAVKNLFGTIPGTQKPECHMRFPEITAFADVMVDLNEYFRPVLSIVDAVVGMEGNGPTSGTPRGIGYLLASRNPYCLDMICADLIGLTRENVQTLQQAYVRKLGPAAPEEVCILTPEGMTWDREERRIRDYRLVSKPRTITFGGGPLGALITGVLKTAVGTRPQVTAKECIGCGKCGNICPAHAIQMKERLPKIDRNLCIHCFCCQEFCPAGAMKVHHTLVGRLVTKINTPGR